MARSDLLLSLAKAGSQGDTTVFKRTLEAIIAEERAKGHHILADRLAGHLIDKDPLNTSNGLQAASGPNDLFYEIVPVKTMEDLILPNVVSSSPVPTIFRVQEMVRLSDPRLADSPHSSRFSR